MKSWEQLQLDAAEFIAFLEQGNFFSQPFTTTKNYRITTDAEEARIIAGRYFRKEKMYSIVKQDFLKILNGIWEV